MNTIDKIANLPEEMRESVSKILGYQSHKIKIRQKISNILLVACVLMGILTVVSLFIDTTSFPWAFICFIFFIATLIASSAYDPQPYTEGDRDAASRREKYEKVKGLLIFVESISGLGEKIWEYSYISIRGACEYHLEKCVISLILIEGVGELPKELHKKHITLEKADLESTHKKLASISLAAETFDQYFENAKKDPLVKAMIDLSRMKNA